MNLAWGAAGFAAITTVWAQIKGLTVRFSSIFFVSAEVEGAAEVALQMYFWKHFKRNPLGRQKYGSYEAFVKPMDRYAEVAVERTGRALTFFQGWKPIFLSSGGGSDNGGITSKNGGSNCITVSFIRGMFDVEKLIVDALDEWNDVLSKAKQKNRNHRYYVQRFFGRSGRDGNSGFDKAEESPKSSISDRLNSRPLKWLPDDLGSPASEHPFEGLAYAPDAEKEINKIRRWYKSEKWYKAHPSIAWRLGVKAFGAPGTGKTSLARALGQEFDMPVDLYDLNTMDNEELVRFWRQSLSHSPCIVLWEDIDRLFDENQNLKQAHSINKSPLTLDCMLNCISGVEPSNGILLIVTANEPHKLPPALTRKGRLDIDIEFGQLTEEGRRKVAERLLHDYPHLIEKAVKEGEGETGAQFANIRCANMALEEYWKEDGFKPTVDPMFGVPSNDPVAGLDGFYNDVDFAKNIDDDYKKYNEKTM